MRIAYLVFQEIDKQSGIRSKIYDQINAWKSLGHHVHLFAVAETYLQKEGITQLNTSRLLKYWFFSRSDRLVNCINKFHPDLIYLRFTPYRTVFSILSKRYPIILEINSDDVAEYRSNLLYKVKKANVKR